MERPKIQSLTFLNKIQTHSIENGKEIFKQLCLRCGGKGFYQNVIVFDGHIVGDNDTSCLECEGGFIYGPREIR